MVLNIMDYESLIKGIRRLRGLMWHTSNQLWSGKLDENKLQELRSLNRQRFLEVTALESNHKFVARTFDVFVSTVDAALQRFEDENPEPPTQKLCNHPTRHLKKRIFSDGSVHCAEQCSTCGVMVKAVKITSDIVLEKLDIFDQSLEENWRKVGERHSQWISARYAEFERAKYAGGDMPLVFDGSSFNAAYEAENPQPITQDSCPHADVEVRYRDYGATNAFVQQCTLCGKHLKSVKKSDYPNVEDMPKFDEVLPKKTHEKYFEWLQVKSAAYDAARKELRDEYWVKRITGELDIHDNSMFSTYYNSPEWANTRIRIFRRDNYICRNSKCGNSAECVHHITYDRLGAENDFDLISLCNACHEKVHVVQRKFPYAYKLTPKEIEILEETVDTLKVTKEFEVF